MHQICAKLVSSCRMGEWGEIMSDLEGVVWGYKVDHEKIFGLSCCNVIQIQCFFRKVIIVEHLLERSHSV